MRYGLSDELRLIFRERLVPGKDQQKIRERFGRIDSLLARAATDPRQATTLRGGLYELEDLNDRVTRHLLNPKLHSSHLRNALNEIRENCVILAERYTARRPRRFIVPADHSLRKVGIPTQGFKHIPYQFIDTDQETELIDALRRTGTPAQQEKIYSIIPLFGKKDVLWNLELVGAPAAWQTSVGQGVKVGIVDTGCDYEHPEIASRFGETLGYNFVANNPDPYDDNGHGTHVGGTIAGANYGVAPGAHLFALKFLDDAGFGSEVGFIKSAEWAIDNGLHILNGSFGSYQSSSAEQAICDELQSRGILFLAAAGNSGQWEYSYPASYASVMSVAAVDRNKERAFFSQQNDRLSFAAPGVAIKSCLPGGQTGQLDGTSMATPHGTGVAALVYSQQPDAEYVRQRLIETAENIGPDDEYGAGLVRADAAVAMRRRGVA